MMQAARGNLWIDGFAIESAIQARRPILIDYVAADGEETTRVIEPYEMAPTLAGNVIVRAMDRRSGGVRSFRLDRMAAVDVLPNDTFVLDREEIDALARVRAQIAGICRGGFGDTAARWSPDDPIYP